MTNLLISASPWLTYNMKPDNIWLISTFDQIVTPSFLSIRLNKSKTLLFKTRMWKRKHIPSRKARNIIFPKCSKAVSLFNRPGYVNHATYSHSVIFLLSAPTVGFTWCCHFFAFTSYSKFHFYCRLDDRIHFRPCDASWPGQASYIYMKSSNLKTLVIYTNCPNLYLLLAAVLSLTRIILWPFIQVNYPNHS